jgi:hypothetical protein
VPAAPAAFGDLLDAVHAAPAPAAAPASPDGPAMPRSPSPSTAANVSARDQLMAMLQAKTRPPTPTPEPAGPRVTSPFGDSTTGERPIPAAMAPAAPVAAARPAEGEGGTLPPRINDARHFREVFEEFVRLRRVCGEPGDLPFDKFCERLEQTRTAVLAQHRGTDVLFTAYVKNGKAALKATPR